MLFSVISRIVFSARKTERSTKSHEQTRTKSLLIQSFLQPVTLPSLWITSQFWKSILIRRVFETYDIEIWISQGVAHDFSSNCAFYTESLSKTTAHLRSCNSASRSQNLSASFRLTVLCFRITHHTSDPSFALTLIYILVNTFSAWSLHVLRFITKQSHWVLKLAEVSR